MLPTNSCAFSSSLCSLFSVFRKFFLLLPKTPCLLLYYGVSLSLSRALVFWLCLSLSCFFNHPLASCLCSSLSAEKKKNLFLDPMTTFNCILTSFVLLTAKFFEDISGENIHRVHQNLTLLFPRKQKPLLYIFLLGNLIYSYGFSCPPCAADFWPLFWVFHFLAFQSQAPQTHQVPGWTCYSPSTPKQAPTFFLSHWVTCPLLSARC